MAMASSYLAAPFRYKLRWLPNGTGNEWDVSFLPYLEHRWPSDYRASRVSTRERFCEVLGDV